MLNYQSPNPSRNFLMIDKEVDNELTPDAYYLLVKLIKLAPNEDNSNNNLRKKTNFSKRKFDRAKIELINKNYLDTKQLYDNKYAFFIGKERVSEYKKNNKRSDNRHDKNYIKRIEESL